MAKAAQLACCLALLLFVAVGAASAAYFPTPAGFKVKNDASLETRTKDGNTPRIIFIDETSQFALEFLSSTGQKVNYGDDSTFYLALVFKPGTTNEPWVPLWSANRDRPVHQNATLSVELGTSAISLVLRDADGSLVWSRAGGNFGSGRPNIYYGIELTSTGNLRFLNSVNTSVWNNWQEPTDCLLPGQSLQYGSKLTSAVSSSNYASGKFSFNAQVAGVTITKKNQRSPIWWKSVIPKLNTVYATEHTCRYIHNTFFQANQRQGSRIVVLKDNNLAPVGVRDTSLCKLKEADETLVVGPFSYAVPPYSGDETITSDQFARLDSDGVLRVYSYSIPSLRFLAVQGARAPPVSR